MVQVRAKKQIERVWHGRPARDTRLLQLFIVCVCMNLELEYVTQVKFDKNIGKSFEFNRRSNSQLAVAQQWSIAVQKGYSTDVTGCETLKRYPLERRLHPESAFAPLVRHVIEDSSLIDNWLDS